MNIHEHSMRRIADLERVIRDKSDTIQSLERQVQTLTQQVGHFEELHRRVLGSRSWRITAPLRLLGSLWHAIRSGLARLKSWHRGKLRGLLVVLKQNKTARRFAKLVLAPFPNLKARLSNVGSKVAGHSGAHSQVGQYRRVVVELDMSRSAEDIYQSLAGDLIRK